MSDTETVTIRLAPLATLMSIYSTAPWNRLDNPDVAEAWQLVSEDMKAEEAAAQEPPLPPGQWGRVELPGYRQHTGWITEEARFGVQMAIVRDFDGREEAAVAVGPGSRVVFLPTPLRRPEPLAGLPAGHYEGYYDEDAGCDCGPGERCPGCSADDEAREHATQALAAIERNEP